MPGERRSYLSRPRADIVYIGIHAGNGFKKGGVCMGELTIRRERGVSGPRYQAAEKTETEKPADAPKDTAKKTTEEKKTTTRKAKAVAEKKAAEKPAEGVKMAG